MNYVDHLLIVISTITGCVFISAFASLVGTPIGIPSSAIWLTICAITAVIEKYKSIIKKKKKKNGKIILLGKSKLGSIEVLISKALIGSNISYDEFGLMNNVLKEFYCLKCRENMQSKNPEIVKTKNERIIPDFGVSMAILNPVDIFRRLCKLNFGLLQGHVNSHHITAILLKE